MPLPHGPGDGPTASTGADSVSIWIARLRLIAVRTAVAIGFGGGRSAAVRQILSRPSDPLAVSTSYVILRNGIGVIGFALPIVMIVGGGLDHIQGSLSAYYHYSPTRPGQYGGGTMRDLFVAMLCAIGAFLLFYRGHSLHEDVALNIAGIAAVLVALFPMDWPAEPSAVMSKEAQVHLTSATIFFIAIAYVCVFRARDTLCILADQGRRKAFERIYLVMGLLMLATPATVALIQYMSSAEGPGYKTLVVESAGVFVFAAFWLVKSYEIRSSLRRASPAAAS